ncbi:PREDICTED: probable S-adenosylmethionine-dependent methyltransferase At5g38100 [Camelina sativa]|uniref:Probable S-adenosylmethionine-dependent methyltransferase At5g38100 n=1 Tax=Camelina sativa TaxID=90675 RepID=A0ABM0YM89_CAMSA|nr:PREDICTED: probable S-adenosylmethionine-dependent methyltransferase At5g38100 [Camelina sativa]
MSTTYSMLGGEGPDSYREHSKYQGALVIAAKENINEVISTKLDIDTSSNLINIADFGCSSGPNTFNAVQIIIDAVELKYKGESSLKDKEFQVFFNDSSNNDFNTLFKTLPPARKYFATGVPGSFFGRVLPRDSLHLGVSSYSLHFISKIPNGIKDRDSPAWNEEIHCSGSSEVVEKLYFEQYKNDVGGFLNARAQEFVSGGLLLLLGSCRLNGIQFFESVEGMMVDCIGSSLNELAKQGIIDQQKLDAFKLPIYATQADDLKQIIEDNGSFTIEAFEKITHGKGEYPLDTNYLTLAFKASLGGSVAALFGQDAMEKTYELVREKTQEMLPQLAKAKPGMQFLIVLRKN